MSSSQDVIVVKARVMPHEIGYVNAQMDACEGIAVLRTVDPQEGRIAFWVSPDLLEEFYGFIQAIREDVPIELELPRHPPDSQGP
jgi:hypothetical protein